MSPQDGGTDTYVNTDTYVYEDTTTATTEATSENTDTSSDGTVIVTSTPAADTGKKSGLDGWTVAEKVGLVLGILASVIAIGTLIWCGCHGWKM